ncbi:hypothetical protein KSP40_PGU017558 [Platanthera guangdongensis]|uniref:Uncharacterized protein n=1 Tax=Platanthera guangdongensis TaxID=2320717 RepID=A0ABR2M2U4_9ASPA
MSSDKSTRYPSTIERWWYSLLCEASLTLCPPIQGKHKPDVHPVRSTHCPIWIRAGQTNLSEYPNTISHTKIPIP